MNDGCFVVPVGCRGTEKEELQWRISTSITERRLMFSLNIVQIRCYVLMKMILKSYQILDSEAALSSFICKTALLHCIEREAEDIWQDNNLLRCLNLCLKFLFDSISLHHCPHFIIRGNNLLARRIPPDVKPQILAVIQNILQSEGRALMEIEIDQLGIRLSNKFHILQPGCTITIQVPTASDYIKDISGHLLYTIMNSLSNFIAGHLSVLTHNPTTTVVQNLSRSIDKLANIYQGSTCNHHEQIACELLSPFLYMSLGSVLASQSISKKEEISHNALSLIRQGSTHDLSSTLKQASVFYCADEIDQALTVLNQIEEQYNMETLQSVCCCYQSRDREGPRREFKEISIEGDIKQVLKHTAFCVRYLPSEVNCVPEELKHEYFRSDLSSSHSRWQRDFWMDWAVVDSIPFYYFLQYKIYSAQGRRDRHQTALEKLRQTTDIDLNLGHRETALNLLGQCLEQEGRLDDALRHYASSKKQRATNNAANSLTSQVSHQL